MGALFFTGKYNILYSGDSRYTDSLTKNINRVYELSDKNYMNIQILNLGGLKRIESEADIVNYKNLYENHLGRAGVYGIVKSTKPEIVLLSEFGEEFLGKRLTLVEKFQETFNKIVENRKELVHTKIFPCEIDMLINLDTERIPKFKCFVQNTGRYEFKEYEKVICDNQTNANGDMMIRYLYK